MQRTTPQGLKICPRIHQNTNVKHYTLAWQIEYMSLKVSKLHLMRQTHSRGDTGLLFYKLRKILHMHIT